MSCRANNAEIGPIILEKTIENIGFTIDVDKLPVKIRYRWRRRSAGHAEGWVMAVPVVGRWVPLRPERGQKKMPPAPVIPRPRPYGDFGIAPLMASEAQLAASCNDSVDKCA